MSMPPALLNCMDVAGAAAGATLLFVAPVSADPISQTATKPSRPHNAIDRDMFFDENRIRLSSAIGEG
jgi:hypothetical protein